MRWQGLQIRMQFYIYMGGQEREASSFSNSKNIDYQMLFVS